jgi:hypothetical protein
MDRVLVNRKPYLREVEEEEEKDRIQGLKN